MSDKINKPIYQKPTARSLDAPAVWGVELPLDVCSPGLTVVGGGGRNWCTSGYQNSKMCEAGTAPYLHCKIGGSG